MSTDEKPPSYNVIPIVTKIYDAEIKKANIIDISNPMIDTIKKTIKVNITFYEQILGNLETQYKYIYNQTILINSPDYEKIISTSDYEYYISNMMGINLSWVNSVSYNINIIEMFKLDNSTLIIYNIFLL